MADHFILSTATFAAWMAGEVNVQSLPIECRIALTPLQCNRLSLLADDVGHASLRQHCFALEVKEGTPAAKTIEEFRAGGDLSVCTTEPVIGTIKDALLEGEIDMHAHDEDIIIVQIALRCQLCVVTSSPTLFGALTEFGGNVMMQDAFFQRASA